VKLGEGEKQKRWEEVLNKPESKEQLLDAFSQATIEDAAEIARSLVDADKGNALIRSAFLSMVVSRRSYQICRLALRNWLDDQTKSGAIPDDVAALVEKSLLLAAEAQGAEAFDIIRLCAHIQNVLFSFVSGEARRVGDRIRGKEQHEAMVKEDARRRTGVQLARPAHYDNSGTTHLQRGKSITFVGTQAAVDGAIRQLTMHVDTKTEPCKVLLNTGDDKAKPMTSAHVSFVDRRWRGCTSKATSMDKQIGSVVGDLPVDLLIVPNILKCGDAALLTYSALNEVHRRLSQWAKERACGMILGIPTDTKDAMPLSLDKLDNHTQLVSVSLDEQGYLHQRWVSQPKYFMELEEKTGDSAVSDNRVESSPSAGGGRQEPATVSA
jgi:hypothetical protein